MTARPGTGRDGAERLAWAALLGIAAVGALRVMVLFVPERYFDVDPALHGTPLAGLAPAGSLALDAALLACCALGLAAEHRAGRRVDPLLLGLALVPLPVVLAHGWSDAGDLWRGTTWAAAAVAAVTIAHLARDGARRAACVGLLLGALVPLIGRGAMQMTVEHADTVAAFEQTREQFFADRGWAPDSPAALIYERRLRQPQPRGWFATSNVLASLLLVGLVAGLGLTVEAARRRLPSGWSGTAGLLALACAAALWLTGSKAGIGAALLGLGLLAVPMLRPALAALLTRRRGALVAALLAGAIAAVVARGALLPERFAGDLSLLFRWHYMAGAGSMAGEALPWGIGPDHFQERYAIHRPARSPEEVISAHGAFVDWLAALGIAGLAWIGLILLGMRGRTTTDAGPEAPAAPLPVATTAAMAAVAVLTVILAMATEQVALDPMSATIRVVGALGFAAVALVVGRVAVALPAPVAAWALGAAAIALLVHAQVEMTLFSPGAVVWAMIAIGLAMTVPARDAAPSGRPVVALALVPALASAWILATGVVPAARQQRTIRSAAGAVHPLDDDPAWRVRQRLTAVERLERAAARWPANERPLLAAVEQLALAAGSAAPDERVALLRRATELAEEIVARHGSTAGAVALAGAATRLAGVTGDSADWAEAEQAARGVTELDPLSIASWTRLGDVLWAAGQRRAAADAYGRALQRSDDFELDPLKQLSSRRRDELQHRIDTAMREAAP
ncbi:MAG: O-antigen ligase family protein [Planctomycetota bacterium]